MRRLLVPPAPGVLCAQGLLAAERRAAFSLTRLARLDQGADLAHGFAALEQQAGAWFDAEAIAPPDRALTRVALMRYHDQGSELTVPFVNDAALLAQAFTQAHAALYGFTLPHAAIELVTLRIEASATMPAPPAERAPAADPRGARVGEQLVWFAEGARAVPVLARDRLGAGEAFDGPAIVVQLDATTLVLPGQRATVQASGALLLEEVA
jgi:N-methylhydantoinase A